MNIKSNIFIYIKNKTVVKKNENIFFLKKKKR